MTATRSCRLLPYLPWPAPPPSESGEGPAVPGPASVAWKRCAALRCAYVRACLPRFARSGPRVREKEGALVGGAEAFPVPRCCPLPRLVRAALRRPLPLRVRSRRACFVRRHGRGPACPRGGVPPGMRASPHPPPGSWRAGGRTNGWWTDGWRKPRRLPCGGCVCSLRGPRVRFFRGGGGSPGPARREGRRRGLVRLGGPARRPGRRGAALCVCGGGIPALFTRWPAQVRCLASEPALVRCARGSFPSCVEPTRPLVSLCATPLPGVTSRRASPPSVPPPSGRPCRPRP